MTLWMGWIFRAGSGYDITVTGADCLMGSICDGKTDQDQEEDETLRVVNDVKGNVDLTRGKEVGKGKGGREQQMLQGWR